MRAVGRSLCLDIDVQLVVRRLEAASFSAVIGLACEKETRVVGNKRRLATEHLPMSTGPQSKVGYIDGWGTISALWKMTLLCRAIKTDIVIKKK